MMLMRLTTRHEYIRRRRAPCRRVAEEEEAVVECTLAEEEEAIVECTLLRLHLLFALRSVLLLTRHRW